MKSNRATTLGYIVVTLGALFYCYEYFLRVAPSVMQPQLMQSFDITATAFGTLSAYYYYAYTPMQLFVGLVVDRFRVRRVLIMAILSCALGSFLMASAHSYHVAALGRFLQGFGSAFAFVGTLKLVSTWLPGSHFAFFAGLAGSLGFLGAAVTQIVLTRIVAMFDWRTSIQIFTGLGLLLAVFFVATLYSQRQAKLVDHSVHSIREGFKNIWAIVKLPRMWVAGLFAYFTFLPTSVFGDLWGIPYMQKLHGYTPEDAALAVSMLFIGWAIGSAIMGWVSDRLRNRIRVMQWGAFLALVLSVVLLYVASIPLWLVCVLFVLFGILSAAETLSFVMARDMCHSHAMVGSAIAFVNTVCMMGGLMFQRGLGQVLDWAWDGTMENGIRSYSLHAYEIAMAIIPISIALAFIMSLFVKDTYVDHI